MPSSFLPVPSKGKGRKNRTWEESFMALVAYKEKHGNCDVPWGYDSALGSWVLKTRRRWHQLTDNQRQRLSQLGFNSMKKQEREEQAWNDQYQRLEAFRREYGHCRVPRVCKEYPRLGKWVANQRLLQKKQQLVSHRFQKLEAIDFAWAHHEQLESPTSLHPVLPSKKARMARTWEESFQSLVAYKAEHGNCDVPYAYAEDFELGRWVSKTRVRWKQLTDNQRQRLSQLGLEPTKRHERQEQAWNDTYQRLKAFRREHGHCRVPTEFKVDPHLGVWVSTQRRLQKKQRLASHRLQKLEAIHFTWTSHDCKRDTSKDDNLWLQKYKKLVKFQSEHGHCMVPSRRSGHQKGLGDWVANQRVYYRRGELRQDRKELLQSIGFVWNLEDSRIWYSSHLPDNGNDKDEEVAPDTSHIPKTAPLYTSNTGSIKVSQANCDEEIHRRRSLDEVGDHEEPNWKDTLHFEGGARELTNKSLEKANEASSKTMRDNEQPRYPIGLQFVKQFGGHGSFEGRITGFDGKHYKVLYPADGDEEELSEWEFELDENVHITTRIPSAGTVFKKNSIPGVVGVHKEPSRKDTLCFDGGARELTHKSSEKANDASRKTMRNGQPRYPIGLQFVKQFDGHGSFEGRIVGFDGKHYRVLYPTDGDEEEMSEWEFELDENVEITTRIPSAGTAFEQEPILGLDSFDDDINSHPRPGTLQPKPPLHLGAELKRPAESGGYDSDEEEEYEFQ